MNAVNGSVPCGDGLTFDEDGTLYAYRSTPTAGPGVPAQLVTIDKHTGAQTLVGQLPEVLVGGGGMTFDADGHLWLYGIVIGDPWCTPSGSYCLYEVNKKTAARGSSDKHRSVPVCTGSRPTARTCSRSRALP